ncbi:MAG: hypothetical protein JW959_13980 [Pirellulales bacterium]|nr:hypothetical protein [Pirellulales bacterium]
MYARMGAIGLLVCSLLSAALFAQTYPQPGPDQPVRPQAPGIERRMPPPADGQRAARPPQPSPAPFALTPQQEAHVDRVLNLWEQRNRKIKTFDCRFKRWIYDAIFSPPRPNQPLQPKQVEAGIIKFAAPDRGLFRVETTEKDGRETPIEEHRMEYWLCDGEAVYEFDAVNRTVNEHKLPVEMRGKAIADGPLPFLFGAEAETLKKRYFIRIITPPDAQEQIWLEAYPRSRQEAANFHHAHFIITTDGMTPFALRIVEPNGKDYRVYQFYDIVVNDPLKFFKGDPFRPHTPTGWRLMPDRTPSSQAGRPAPPAGRR